MATENMACTGQTDETDRLISSDKVDGTSVYNRKGDNVGTIDHLMIDKISGQVEYVVMSTGGFRRQWCCPNSSVIRQVETR